MTYSRLIKSSLLFVLGCSFLSQGSLCAKELDPIYEVELASTHRTTTKTTSEEGKFKIIPVSSFKTTTKTTRGEFEIIPISTYKTTTKTTQRDRGRNSVSVADWSSSSLHSQEPTTSKQMRGLEELSRGVPHPLFHSGVQVGTFLIDGETNTLTLQLSKHAEFAPGTEVSLFSFEHDVQTSWELVVLDEQGTPIDALAEERMGHDGRMAYVLIFESTPSSPEHSFKGRLARTFFC
ncbi:MAG: hypothetical protein K940chlam9_01782 [Chlamydiae bacterium]|nr:hypothetical protein [Chlamydiota bacterium]